MADQETGSPNAAQIEFWNSAAARAWADQYERMDRAVADLTKSLLDLAAPQPSERVLDIGCGSGTTVLELAARVGPGGHVLGADISEQSELRKPHLQKRFLTRQRLALFVNPDCAKDVAANRLHHVYESLCERTEPLAAAVR